MKKLLFLIILITIYGCSKPKTVLICGDHICVNKVEAEEYFKENLTLEVRIIDKKNSSDIDLVEINLKSKSNERKQISIANKRKTNKKLKILSNDEIEKTKAQLKEKRKQNKKKAQIVNKKEKKKFRLFKDVKKEKIEKKQVSKTVKLNEASNINKKIVNKNNKKAISKSVDICEFLKECTIDEISKYLIKKGNKNNFPDITTRE